MAADLVASPNVRQTFVHDLESFFWVMFWIILTRVKCSWDVDKRSSFIGSTFSPRVYGRSGGDVKVNFLRSKETLMPKEFEIGGNPSLSELLFALKDLFSIRHSTPPSIEDYPRYRDTERPSAEEIRLMAERHRRALECLKDHAETLKIFENALRDPWPTDNDEAKVQRLRLSKSDTDMSNHGSKRTREQAEEANGTFNQPSSSKRQS